MGISQPAMFDARGQLQVLSSAGSAAQGGGWAIGGMRETTDLDQGGDRIESSTNPLVDDFCTTVFYCTIG